MKAHGGEIWVESQETRGSAFTFLLPLVRESKTSRSSEAHVETYESTMKGLGGGAVNFLPGNNPGRMQKPRLAAIQALGMDPGAASREKDEAAEKLSARRYERTLLQALAANIAR